MIAELSENQVPLSRPAEGYWHESRRPLVSMAFVLPLLMLYEGGVLILGTKAVRNGADVWLRQLLDAVGLGSYFLLPLLTVLALLCWHHTTRQRWKVRPGVLYGMVLESASLGFALVLIAHLQGTLLTQLGIAAPSAPAASVTSGAVDALGKLVGFFGAGIYEEVLFRLLLLPAVIAVAALLHIPLKARIVASVLLTSLAFSAAHYLGAHGEPLIAFTFVFRFVAGGFFAVLFVYRGFGIAAGTHALYDIFVGIA